MYPHPVRREHPSQQKKENYDRQSGDGVEIVDSGERRSSFRNHRRPHRSHTHSSSTAVRDTHAQQRGNHDDETVRDSQQTPSSKKKKLSRQSRNHEHPSPRSTNTTKNIITSFVHHHPSDQINSYTSQHMKLNEKKGHEDDDEEKAEQHENDDGGDHHDDDQIQQQPSSVCNYLRCQPIPDDTSSLQVVWWKNPPSFVPIAIEEELIPILMRWKDTERGMMCSQPSFRLPPIRKFCERHNIPLLTALSLRRHHIKRYNPYQTMHQLKLGSDDNIREAAALFEESVRRALITKYPFLKFWTEQEQRQYYTTHKPRNELRSPPTPDFVLEQPVRLKIYTTQNSSDIPVEDESHRIVQSEHVISWIEVKMFYGASTIPAGSNSAVGCILRTCRKYVDWHGPGAVVFLYGCGDQLAEQLDRLGVIALDGSASPRVNGLDLRHLQAQQRTWCANGKGEILI